MEERTLEHMIEKLMQQDFSAGTEHFREALLERCLSVLGSEGECAPLDDTDLDLLAAAGQVDVHDYREDELRNMLLGIDARP